MGEQAGAGSKKEITRQEPVYHRYNWSLPVIRADEGSCVLMTDKRYQSAHLENCIHVHLNQ